MDGDTVAVRVVEFPIFRLAEDCDRVTFVAAALETVTLQVAVFPFVVLAVMVAEPAFTPVIFPFEIVATAVLEEVQVTV